MTVYVVVRWYDFETMDVWGVYDDEDAAQAEADRLNEEHRSPGANAYVRETPYRRK